VNYTQKPVFLLNKTKELFVKTSDVSLSAPLDNPQAIRKISDYLKEKNINFLI